MANDTDAHTNIHNGTLRVQRVELGARSWAEAEAGAGFVRAGESKARVRPGVSCIGDTRPKRRLGPEVGVWRLGWREQVADGVEM